MREQFEENGYYVLRGVLTEDEVDQLARPIRAGFQRGEYDKHRGEGSYPEPGIYSMGPRVLDEHPDIAAVSLAHSAIVEAVEALFGEPAALGQFWSIMRPPGAGVSDEPFVKGSGAHYDYKPWRCVGSYVKWMFAVIPFVDYIESAGPLVVSPGSHRKTTTLPSNGRVHQVDAARVPKARDVKLVDPQLRKGDVVLMHGFTWHEARPNYGNSDRCGLYLKFYAQSSPPACGPTIFPTAVRDALPEEMRHLVPQHRSDGQYASMRDGPVGGVDEGQILLEDAEDRVLVLGDDTGGYHLPRFAAAEDETASILDVSNVMGSVLTGVAEQLGLELPWLSWLQDVAGPAGTESSEFRRRVYGHRLSAAAPPITQDVAYAWMSPDELAVVNAEGLLEDGVQVLKWLDMWTREQDEHGNAVTRSYGLPTTHVRYFRYNGNGNQPGTYRVGEFDPDGKPKADATRAGVT